MTACPKCLQTVPLASLLLSRIFRDEPGEFKCGHCGIPLRIEMPISTARMMLVWVIVAFVILKVGGPSDPILLFLSTGLLIGFFAIEWWGYQRIILTVMTKSDRSVSKPQLLFAGFVVLLLMLAVLLLWVGYAIQHRGSDRRPAEHQIHG